MKTNTPNRKLKIKIFAQLVNETVHYIDLCQFHSVGPCRWYTRIREIPGVLGETRNQAYLQVNLL